MLIAVSRKLSLGSDTSARGDNQSDACVWLQFQWPVGPEHFAIKYRFYRGSHFSSPASISDRRSMRRRSDSQSQTGDPGLKLQ